MRSREDIVTSARSSPPGAAALEPGDRKRPSSAVMAMVARLGRGRALKTAARWPDGELEFDLWVLTQSERDEAEALAAIALKRRGLDIGSTSPIVVESCLVAKGVHVLAAAMRDRESGEPVFSSAQELADVATDDEIDKLIGMYAEHRASNDPALRAMTEAEVSEIEVAVKKKDLIRLSSIASSMPKGSLLTLVALLATLLIGKSSSTSSESVPL